MTSQGVTCGGVMGMGVKKVVKSGGNANRRLAARSGQRLPTCKYQRAGLVVFLGPQARISDEAFFADIMRRRRIW